MMLFSCELKIINTFPILAYPPTRLVEIAKTRFTDVFKDRDSLAHLANSIHIYTEITCEDLMGRQVCTL